MGGFFNNLSQYNQYRDTMTGATPIARHGALMGGATKSQPKSRSWEMVKEFKGKSHKDGGIDIEVGEGYVRSLSGKDIQPDDIAKNGRIWRSIGATAYGLGEGLLDTITLGTTDQLTDAGYNALQKAGGGRGDELREQNSLRGYGTAAGAIGGGILTGGATTGSAIQQGAKGLGAGVSAGSPDSKIAQQVGNFLPLAGNIAGMAMGNAGFKDATGAAASLGKFSGQAQKYGKLMPFAAQGVNMLGNTGQSVIPEMGSGVSIPQNINAILQSYQMLNSLRGPSKGKESEIKSDATKKAEPQETTSSMMPMSNYYSQVPSMMRRPSQYQFVNDLKSYGINS